jgi:glutaredoxin
VREFLSARGVKYVERNVEDSREAREEMLERTGYDVVPALVTREREVVIGFDEGRLREIYKNN